MKGKLIILRANGEVREKEITSAPDLEELQKIVDGWIEEVPFFKVYRGKPCVAFCNEEGKLRCLPFNARATEAWKTALRIHLEKQGKPFGGIRDALVGNIVIVTGDKELLEDL